MTRQELKDKLRLLIKQVYPAVMQSETAVLEYDELTKFPELKAVIIDLLTYEFDNFLASIDWVAPRPSTFRINLKNGELFYLIYNGRSWVAQVEGKNYYLLNLPEEEQAAMAIARILRYGSPDAETEEVETTETETEETETEETTEEPAEEPAAEEA
jgi:hypothetical protein